MIITIVKLKIMTLIENTEIVCVFANYMSLSKLSSSALNEDLKMDDLIYTSEIWYFNVFRSPDICKKHEKF